MWLTWPAGIVHSDEVVMEFKEDVQSLVLLCSWRDGSRGMRPSGPLLMFAFYGTQRAARLCTVIPESPGH